MQMLQSVAQFGSSGTPNKKKATKVSYSNNWQVMKPARWLKETLLSWRCWSPLYFFFGSFLGSTRLDLLK